jgi:hypothetical protein
MVSGRFPGMAHLSYKSYVSYSSYFGRTFASASATGTPATAKLVH